MRQLTFLPITVLFLIGLGIPDRALSHDLFSFPDIEALHGIHAIVVAPVTFIHMETVNLTSDTLRTSIQIQLRNAGITVMTDENLPNDASSVVASPRKYGILAAVVRRWDSPVFLGMTSSSFAVSLQFYQKARVQPTQRETWVITWLETKSVLAGTKRPKDIELALENLVRSFILDFNRM